MYQISKEEYNLVESKGGGMYKGIPFKYDGFSYSFQEGRRIVRLKTLQAVCDYIDQMKGGC